MRPLVRTAPDEAPGQDALEDAVARVDKQRRTPEFKKSGIAKSSYASCGRTPTLTPAQKGAQSAIMMYSYKCTLARRAVVATFDLSAANLVALSKDHWMKNSLNIVQLHLHESVKRSK